MDDFILVSSWNKTDLIQAPLQITVEGLHIQGCLFDGLRLSEASSNDANIMQAPIATLAWVPKVLSIAIIFIFPFLNVITT